MQGWRALCTKTLGDDQAMTADHKCAQSTPSGHNAWNQNGTHQTMGPRSSLVELTKGHLKLDVPNAKPAGSSCALPSPDGCERDVPASCPARAMPRTGAGTVTYPAPESNGGVVLELTTRCFRLLPGFITFWEKKLFLEPLPTLSF